MNQPEYRQFLKARKLSDEQIELYIAMGTRFEAFLSACQPPATIEQASAEAVRAFVDLLIAEGQNSFESLLAVARYGQFSKNHTVYIASLELLDGGEVLEGMYRKIGLVLGEQQRDTIFAGIDLPPLGTSNWQKSSITRTIMQRLEECLDVDTYRKIFSSSFRDLPDRYYLDDKKHYDEIGNFDQYLEWKRRAFIDQLEQIKAEGGLYFTQEISDAVIDFVRSEPEISQGVRQGRILYVTKIPYMTKEYLAETDPDKKRYYYCHCPWARESLRQAGGPVSAKFCQCSAGYHKRPWEVIFGQSLEADVLESVVQGDMRCRFAIHLPESVQEGGA